MDSYDPWHALNEIDGVHLVVADLPGRRRGEIDFETRTITLHPRLRPVERRCTLAHELVHLERGPVLIRQTNREERIVSAIAARRLVSVGVLAAALQWSDDPRVIADELGVDERTIRIRLANLTESEQRTLRTTLERLP
jgi:Zn-dependent peptidase ImmA (M78 family)